MKNRQKKLSIVFIKTILRQFDLRKAFDVNKITDCIKLNCIIKE